MFQGHGDDAYLQKQTVLADFSTNVYDGGAPPGLKEYLFAQWDKIHRYPEVLAESLTEKIAAHYGFPGDHILVTNGTTESIYLIAQAFKNSQSTIVIPAFAEYEDACRMHGHTVTFMDWEMLEMGRVPDTDIVFLCNPNNPTGSVFEAIELLTNSYKEILFIVDEAFIEFTYSVSSIINLTRQYSNLVVMRSMTKAYAVPGLRLGYIAAHPNLINRFRSAKLPWSVNTMALEAGHFIFDRYDQISLPLQEILLHKADFIQGLESTSLKIQESHTHFFLAETTQGTAAELKQFLLENFNLLIRDASNFRGLTKKHIRIATLAPAKNKLLLNALADWKHT
jgi:threonine-phosphate decarboxylase